MLTSVRGLAATTILVGAAAVATPAAAGELDSAIINVDAAAIDAALASNSDGDDVAPVTEAIPASRGSEPAELASAVAGESGFEASANAALTSDYPFRGVSLSGGDMAIQGGFDIAHSSGVYVGTWASSINGGGAYGDLELDLYGGWSGDVAEGVTLDLGILYYAYPTEESEDGFDDDVNYWEPYASVGFTLGPVATTVGAAYAWKQSSLAAVGKDDNLYLYTDLEVGVPGTPLTLAGHLGYTDGALAPDFVSGAGLDRTAWDWSVGASATVLGPLSVSVAYVGVEDTALSAAGAAKGFTDDTIVATLSAEF